MDCPKFILSNLREESIGTQSVQLTIVILSVYRIINPLSAIDENCRLLSLLLMNFGSLYIANNMNRDQTAPLDKQNRVKKNTHPPDLLVGVKAQIF